MIYTVLICTAPRTRVLADLTGALADQGILPDVFVCECKGAATLQIRLTMGCTHAEMNALRFFCETVLQVKSCFVGTIFQNPEFGATPARADTVPPDSRVDAKA